MIYNNTHEFISGIKRELAGGNGFTPFVGSGISAQSGIIMSQQFSNYLAYCVYRVLEPQSEQRWNVRKRGWPPQPNGKETDTMYQYFSERYAEVCTLYRCKVTLDNSSGRPLVANVLAQSRGTGATYGTDHWPSRDLHFQRPLVPEILRSSQIWQSEDDLDASRRHLEVSNMPCDPNASQTSNNYLMDRALRALAHWTLTLEFLARAAISSDGRVYLDEIDLAVIDSFNAHITRGKRPNLIHNMISRLSRALRTHVILTTNFDTLIEQSYRAQGEPLHTLAVSIRGGLPAYETVRSQDCLVKLHGDILETRADSSINHPPSEKDKSCFFKYLRGPNAPHKKQPLDFRPSNLLVVGYSASDARCVQMIKFALDIDADFKVYWICHSSSDLDNVKRIFREYLDENDGACGTIHALVTDRSDLLLWELYQSINLSLPGGGYSIQFNHHVPPERPAATSSGDSGALFLDIKKEMTTNVVCVNAKSGTGEPMTNLFFEFRRRRYQTMWLELEDYADPTDLFFNILSIISIRMGYFQLEWINFLPAGIRQMKDADATTAMKIRLRLLVEKYRITPSEWVLFLYGRNCPGGCAGWTQHYWKKKEYAQMEALMLLFKAVGFNVIYMPYSTERNRRNIDKAKHIMQVAERIGKKTMFLPSGGVRTTRRQKTSNPVEVALETVHTISHAKGFYDFKGLATIKPRNAYEDTINQVSLEFISLAIDEPDGELKTKCVTRMLWLYGLTLFRQARHPAAMISEAVFPCPFKFNLRGTDNDGERQMWVFDGNPKAVTIPEQQGWFPWLANVGLFLRKPGGYAWKYRDSRLGLQYILEHVGKFELKRDGHSQAGLEVANLKSLRGRIHYWIGDWYLRAFLATGHYIPVVEGIYHSASAMLLAENYIPPKPAGEKTKKFMLALQRARLFWRALCQLRRLLRVGAKSLRFWCPGAAMDTAILPKIERLTVVGDLICCLNLEGTGLNTRIAKGLQALEIEMQHVAKSVQAEGLAHGDQFAPFIVSAQYDETVKALSHGLKKAAKSPVVKLPSVGHFTRILGRSDWTHPFCKLLKDVGFLGRSLKETDLSKKLQSAELADDFRQWKRRWLNNWAKKNANEAELVQLIWVLTELMYRIVRRAKFLHHGIIPSSVRGNNRQVARINQDIETVKHCWRSVCVLGYNSLQLCRDLSPDIHNVDCDQRVRILTLYGLALGYLGRPYESNRRFNESHALVVSGLGITEGKELARIHLRRAEMLLYQAKSIIPGVKKSVKQRMAGYTKLTKVQLAALVIARIDDSWKAIERGEISLAGVNHSSFWWYRMYVLKLGCYAALADLKEIYKTSQDRKLKDIDFKSCLPFRRRQHFPTLLVDLLRDAWIIGSGDVFRQLRALEYAKKADSLEDERTVFGSVGLLNLKETKEPMPELNREIRSLLVMKGSVVAKGSTPPAAVAEGGEPLINFWRSVRNKFIASGSSRSRA